MATQPSERWKIWVDTGGTFTDCLAYNPSGVLHRVKVLSDSTLRGKLLEAISPTQWKIQQKWHINNADLLNGYTFQLPDSPNLLVKKFQPSQ